MTKRKRNSEDVGAGSRAYWFKRRHCNLHDTVEELAKQFQRLDICPKNESSGTFTLSPRLPTELRLLIWKHARPAPRILQMECKDDLIYSRTPVPPILHACAESREVALKWYSLHVQRGYGNNVPTNESTPFDLERDYLYITCRPSNPVLRFMANGGKLKQASNVVFHDLDLSNASAIPRVDNYRICLGLWAFCSKAKNVVFIDRATPEFKLSTKLEDLKKVNKGFGRQRGRSAGVFLADGLSLYVLMDYPETRRKKLTLRQAKNFKPKKMARFYVCSTLGTE